MEFNTGRINLEIDENKEKWFCPLCNDFHTEDKETYEKIDGSFKK